MMGFTYLNLVTVCDVVSRTCCEPLGGASCCIHTVNLTLLALRILIGGSVDLQTIVYSVLCTWDDRLGFSHPV
jgi:hypothetical protein